MHPLNEQLQSITRREFFKRSGFSVGTIALASLLSEESAASEAKRTVDPLMARRPHFKPRAKRVIYLHMVGAPSQLDLFDFKPELVKHDGELCPKEFIEGKRFAFLRGHPKLLGTKFKFGEHGQSGVAMSELLPHLSKLADELTFIKSVHTDEFNHGPAQLFLHTGF